jgi:hypothetical protein
MYSKAYRAKNSKLIADTVIITKYGRDSDCSKHTQHSRLRPGIVNSVDSRCILYSRYSRFPNQRWKTLQAK